MKKFDPRWLGAKIDFADWHFHRRLYERYSIVLEPGEYSLIMKKIRDGEVRVIPKYIGGHGREEGTIQYLVKFWRVGSDGDSRLIRLNVVFDINKSHLVTALPRKLQSLAQKRRTRERNYRKKHRNRQFS